MTDNGLGTIFVAACRIFDCFTLLPAAVAPLVIKLIEDNAAERQSYRKERKTNGTMSLSHKRAMVKSLTCALLEAAFAPVMGK